MSSPQMLSACISDRLFFFFFKQKTAYEMRISDWSSDVCSSDLGGVAGSGQGIACHRFRGSYIAVLAEARLEGGRPRVDRLVAAVDCGRLINPDVVRQQIESGLIFGMATALDRKSTRLNSSH